MGALIYNIEAPGRLHKHKWVYGLAWPQQVLESIAGVCLPENLDASGNQETLLCGGASNGRVGVSDQRPVRRSCSKCCRELVVVRGDM